MSVWDDIAAQHRAAALKALAKAKQVEKQKLNQGAAWVTIDDRTKVLVHKKTANGNNYRTTQGTERTNASGKLNLDSPTEIF
jgi:hypothetical protein